MQSLEKTTTTLAAFLGQVCGATAQLWAETHNLSTRGRAFLPYSLGPQYLLGGSRQGHHLEGTYLPKQVIDLYTLEVSEKSLPPGFLLFAINTVNPPKW